LRSRGFIDGDALTDAGREAREAVESHTDDQMSRAIDALGPDADALFARLEPWGRAVIDAAGYLRSSPAEMAGRIAN
jgi:hypothetical protein